MPSPPLAQFASGLSAKDAERVEKLDSTLEQLEEQMASLRKEHRRLGAERQALAEQAQRALEDQSGRAPRPSQAVDFSKPALMSESGQAVCRVAQRYWPSFKTFRYCQEGVVRAILDRRHVFVVMPTGGGKSFCYQLPAMFQAGITLVISPLVSLMHDQAQHLREQGIPCDLLTAGTPREEKTRLNRLIRGMTPRNNPPLVDYNRAAKPTFPPGPDDGADGRPPKLLYVTPEQLTKNKTLRAALQSAEEAGSLASIVVDEAHCCSQYGHDFRPDYRKLDLLTKFFTQTPLACFTATAPPEVVEDVLECLGLPPFTESEQALPNRTVYFSSPLIRDNLTYSVLPKSTGKDEYEDIAQYIRSHHLGDTGIVYCLSQRNAEDMALQLEHLASGTIRARAYHAGMEDDDKAHVHRRWMDGKIHVICATTAFGMGIDKPDVRFVLHATMPTSIEGLYQESGRAGRDGKPADCVLFYRPQDGVRIASVASDSPGGGNKVRSMLSYCQGDFCRKVFFCEYFQDAHSDFSPCGACDNCQGHDDLCMRDLSVEAWKALHALARIKIHQGRVTLGQLTELVRGNNRGRYEVVGGPNGQSSRKSFAATGVEPPGHMSKVGVLNMDDFGGKIVLTKQNTERLLIHLWTRELMLEEYVQTPHTVNVYLDLGFESWRLRRMTLEQAQDMVRTAQGPERVVLTVFGQDGLRSKNARTASPRKSKSERSIPPPPPPCNPRAAGGNETVLLSDDEYRGQECDLGSPGSSDSETALAVRPLKRRARDAATACDRPKRLKRATRSLPTLVADSSDG